MNNSLPSYQGLLDDATEMLYQVSDTPRIDAEVLLQHVTERPMVWLIGYGNTVAMSNHIKAFYELIVKRQAGHPIAYLIGERDFWTLSLRVDENVLIPRPDTETLVEHALSKLTELEQVDVLDLGTGSGAIALSIAKERPLANVLAVEYQQAALDLAIENAELNDIENVEFIRSNWFESIPQEQKFDLIASNPPYVEPDDPHLRKGDLRFEPETALIAKDRGLADLKIIIGAAKHYLRDGGWLLVEHGYNQADTVAGLFALAGFKRIKMHKDLNQLPRCTLGQV